MIPGLRRSPGGQNGNPLQYSCLENSMDRRAWTLCPWDERPYGTKRMKLLFEKGPLFYAEYNIRLFFFLLFHRANLLLSNDLDTILPNYFISKLKRCKMVFDSHEYFTETPELVHRPKVQKVWKRIEGFVVPKLNEMITVCDSIADLFRQKYGVKCHVIRNIPPRKALPSEGEKAVLGLPTDKHLLVFACVEDVRKDLFRLGLLLEFQDPP